MIIYNGQIEEKQKEELERRQRRQFSNVGLAASAFLILPIILQMLAALGLSLIHILEEAEWIILPKAIDLIANGKEKQE